jgi:hypothetical protein
VRVKGRTLCGLCAAGDKTRQATRQGLIIWIVLIATAVAWLADSPPLLRAVLTYSSLIWLTGALLTLLHEAGHTLAALVLGVRVLGVDLGAEGPVIASLSSGQFTLRLRLFPIGGLTRLEPAKRAVRIRHVVIALAGPLTDLALIVAALTWHPAGWVMLAIKSDILFLGALSVLINLVIPLPGRGNDASHIWQLVTMADDEVDAMTGIGKHDEIVRLLNDHMTGEPLSETQLNEIRGFFLERLQHPGLSESARALESNNLAAVDLTIGRPDLLEEADELSRFAYEALPIPAVTSTRGSALVAMGRHAEGCALLERALPGLQSLSKDSTHANLALGALLVGDLFAARSHLGSIRTELNLPAYREALRLIGPAEIRNALTHYWTDERSAREVAALIADDAGPVALRIGSSISEALLRVPAAELADLFAELVGIGMSPDEAESQIGALAEGLMSSGSVRYRRLLVQALALWGGNRKRRQHPGRQSEQVALPRDVARYRGNPLQHRASEERPDDDCYRDPFDGLLDKPGDEQETCVAKDQTTGTDVDC